MTKKELVTAISARTRLTKKDTAVFSNALIHTVTDELSAGNEVNISGFGCFDVRSRKERTCLVPLTSDKVTVPATKAPAFRPGKTLKAKIAE